MVQRVTFMSVYNETDGRMQINERNEKNLSESVNCKNYQNKLANQISMSFARRQYK
jgi:hypothetical protein